jgi:hypothetical protein
VSGVLIKNECGVRRGEEALKGFLGMRKTL